MRLGQVAQRMRVAHVPKDDIMPTSLAHDRYGSYAACLVVVGMLLTGCQHGQILPARGQQDMLAALETARGHVVLESAHMRAVVELEQDAALKVTTQDAANPMLMEFSEENLRIRSDRLADRLVLSLSGVAALAPDAWQVLEQEADRLVFQRDVQLMGERGGAFALSVQREIRLHDADALLGFVPQGLSGRLQVSGVESRTFFTNPGPLPWPRRDGLPYIRIEGDLRRSADTLLILHLRPGSEGVVRRQFAQPTAAAGLAFAGKIGHPDAQHLRLPRDFVLPRLAFVDRSRELLTLIAFTPTIGVSASPDAGASRPDPEIILDTPDSGACWIRVVTSGVAMPLATGGSTRHHRQMFHVRGPVDDLLVVAAAFCRLPHEDLMLALRGLAVEGNE